MNGNDYYVEHEENWFNKEENCNLHYQVTEGLGRIPTLMAIDICVKFLDDCGYKVVSKHKDQLIQVVEDIFGGNNENKNG